MPAQDQHAPRAGRPRYEPTEQQRKTVRAMAAYGIQQAQICAVLGITDKTLRKHFRTELDVAAPEANARVAEALYKKALGGDVNAMKFFLACRADWRERHEVAGIDGAPIATSLTISFKRPDEAA